MSATSRVLRDMETNRDDGAIRNFGACRLIVNSDRLQCLVRVTSHGNATSHLLSRVYPQRPESAFVHRNVATIRGRHHKGCSSFFKCELKQSTPAGEKKRTLSFISKQEAVGLLD
jgi:hypothetical protein